jgi:lipoate-protein ligase A
MFSMEAVRLIIDPPLEGPDNMARDQALLESCAEARSEPVLRFYSWSPATISLGRFQKYAEYEQLPPPAGALPVVRRTTGGGAILHDLEVTYSLAIPTDHPLIAGHANRLYERAHDAIIAAIGPQARRLGSDDPCCDASSLHGPFFCFARRHGLDVVIRNAEDPTGFSKIAGSAQRRSPRAILQHGSIMLDSRYEQQPVATWTALDGPVSFQAAVDRLIPAFEREFGITLRAAKWGEKVLVAAANLRPRYTAQAWTKDRA